MNTSDWLQVISIFSSTASTLGAVIVAYKVGRKQSVGLQRRQLAKECMEQLSKCIHILQNVEYNATKADEERNRTGNSSEFTLKKENAAHEFTSQFMILQNILTTMEYVTTKAHFTRIKNWIINAGSRMNGHDAVQDHLIDRVKELDNLINGHQKEISRIIINDKVEPNEARRRFGKEKNDEFIAFMKERKELTESREYGELQKPLITHFNDLYMILANDN